ncbi:MAG TPA: hypothetical protein H9898_07415 [Candidatus Anaerobiospirillum stercoravium]|nr:hypothetical protein [Candidatus Anaerobiospirillum stercoravium]
MILQELPLELPEPRPTIVPQLVLQFVLQFVPHAKFGSRETQVNPN